MHQITLKDFADDKGQTKAAQLLGLTQGALNKAIRVGRDIYVTEHGDGTYTAEEIKPFPAQQARQETAA